ncbi:two-component regulator propeller domain-containing protein [Accumulibacter sp.]|uniref:two-component regulator propeller domain-containing protein n=1 Tax=Accumulibacter sp. TaxID=2053492 RepID=UPI003457CB53
MGRSAAGESLSATSVQRLVEDTDGALWVATNQGLKCFDGANATFKRMTSRTGVAFLLFDARLPLVAQPTAIAILDYSDGSVWRRPPATCYESSFFPCPDTVEWAFFLSILARVTRNVYQIR